MTNLKMYLFLLTMLLVLSMSYVRAQTTREELVNRLKGDQYTRQLKHERETLIKDLIEIVADDEMEKEFRDKATTPHDLLGAVYFRIRAVELLGDIRASEATDILIEQIVQISNLVTNLDVEETYPCARALIKIGKPASKAVLNELRKPISDRRHFVLTMVLLQIEGNKVGRFMLQEEIAGAKTPQERENLQAALKLFLP